MSESWLRKLKNPEYYKGHADKTVYFEGWYFKQTTTNENCTISFIPGVSFNDDDRHAFIQVIVSPAMSTHYFRFDMSDFKAEEDAFRIQIGPNVFSGEGVTVELVDEALSLCGHLEYKGLKSIGRNIWMPNIMGPFGYLTFMECNHGVISMEHQVFGSLAYNGQNLDFDGGKGYIEKDWGVSFPKHYIWLQCNHFDRDDVSFMFSLAHIPFRKSEFNGFLCNLIAGGREYRFATYTRAKIEKVTFAENQVDVFIQDPEYNLHITAVSKEVGELIAPKDGKMHHVIKEGLEGEIHLELTDWQGQCFLETRGVNAGVEWVDIEKLITAK